MTLRPTLHDNGYKFLFSHAELVQELLEAFAPTGVSALLDYSTLRLENGHYVTPAMRRREDDIVWSVELNGERIYLYLLMEFQSTIDRAMSVRIMQYVAALYDHLLRSKVIDIDDGLPPVLPVLIYNGDARWRHSAELYDAIRSHPAPLKPFQPRLKFWLIDEGAYGAATLEAMQRVTAAIFRFEHTPDIESAKQAIRHLAKMVAQSPHKQRIDRAVMQWMKYRLSHKLPGVAVPDVEQLLEGTDMLETNIDRWKAQAIAEGVLLGEQRGEHRGRLLGEREGRLLGEQAAKRSLLLRTVSRRFKYIPDVILQRIEQASVEQIDDWFDRAVDAPSLEEVLAQTTRVIE